MPQAKPTPGPSLLTPTDHTLLLIDFQSQMAFATQSTSLVELRNNAGLVAHAARAFDVPTIVTSVAAESFRADTYGKTVAVATRFGGGYGIGLNYAKRMFGGHEGR